MIEKREITTVILAGGKSSRMMKDKGLVLFHDKMLIEHVLEKVKKISGNIIIITQNEAYGQFGFTCYADILKEKGPLGGIFTGLINSTTKKNLVIGCDMPFVTENILNFLIKTSEDEDALVAVYNNKPEPLCAIYDRNCIPHFRTLIEQGKLKITDALQDLKTRMVNFDKEDWVTGNEFANINTSEELERYRNNKKNKLL
jgi:molybdopterin-guanine dinucleotide biosynthesis protein A